MAYEATIYIEPVGVAPLGFSQAAGMPGDFRFHFKNISNLPWAGVADLYPQLVMRPFTRPGAYGYDIEIDDPTGASGIAHVPGVVLNDNFNAEVYIRNSTGQPQGLLASGRFSLNGYAYASSGPLGPASYPTGAEGPAGPVGAKGDPGAPGDPGLRGSRWYTGAGPPALVPDERVTGDMWLNETNGDVWRWDGTTWTAFKGV